MSSCIPIQMTPVNPHIMLNNRSPLPRTHDPRNRNINAHRITGSIAQQIHIRAPELLRHCEPGHTAIVAHLEVLIGRLLDVVGHSSLHEARRDGVDADAVLGSLHSECVRYVAHSGLSAAIGCRRRGAIWAVGCHGCGKDDQAFDAECNEFAGRDLGVGEGAEDLGEDVNI